MSASSTDIFTNLLSDRDFAESVLSLINSNLDAVITINTTGMVVAWNVAAEEIFGYRPEEAIGNSIGKLIVPDVLRDAHQRKLATFAIDRESAVVGKRIEIEAKTKSNNNIIVEMQIAHVILKGKAFFTARIRDITERRMFELRSKMLIDELNHRVKNTLTAVSAVARQSAKNALTMPDFMEKFDGRIQALANTHHLLTAADQQGIDLRNIFLSELRPYEGNVHIDGQSVYVPGNSTLTVTMCVHELVTNAVKYGALSQDSGQLNIGWSVRDEDLVIEWKESGGPPICEPPSRKGFGTKLLGLSMADLKGAYEVEYAHDGLIAELRIPKSKVHLDRNHA